jgi:hypothetical protein
MPSHDAPSGFRTFIAVVLDRSGSMAPLRDDAIGGFNTLLEEQRAQAGEGRLLLVQFDRVCEIVCDAVPLENVPALSRATYVPGAGTALLDALGHTLHEVEARIEGLPNAARPDRVLIAVITDGEENSSRKYSAPDVRRMIQASRARGWDFLFLGTSSAAIEESMAWGIDPSATLHFSATAVGLRQAFRAIGDSLNGRLLGATPDDPAKKAN